MLGGSKREVKMLLKLTNINHDKSQPIQQTFGIGFTIFGKTKWLPRIGRKLILFTHDFKWFETNKVTDIMKNCFSTFDAMYKYEIMEKQDTRKITVITKTKTKEVK